jgi:hypothetical protein
MAIGSLAEVTSGSEAEVVAEVPIKKRRKGSPAVVPIRAMNQFWIDERLGLLSYILQNYDGKSRKDLLKSYLSHHYVPQDREGVSRNDLYRLHLSSLGEHPCPEEWAERMTECFQEFFDLDLVREGRNGNVWVTDKGRKELGLLPLNDVRMKDLQTDANFRILVLQVLALRSGEKNYSFAKLLADCKKLARQFQFDSSGVPEAFFDSRVCRAVDYLSRRERPQVTVSRTNKGEHIAYLY